MPSKQNPPPRASARGGNGAFSGDVQPQSSEPNTASQLASAPPADPNTLAWSPHSATAGIRITVSRDHSRISIETWTRSDGRWRLSGVQPSFAAVMLDAVVNALHMARDRRAGER